VVQARLLERLEADGLLQLWFDDVGWPRTSARSSFSTAPNCSTATKVAVVVLTMHAEEEYVLRALAAGAGGYVLKLAEPEAVVEAIGRAVKGELYLDPAVAGPVARRAIQPAKADPLTAREREVLECIARGLTNRQIAEELFVSVNTVETHRRHLLEKLGVHSRAGLVAQALARGLLGDHPITSTT
jgi:two-component system, NarL family, response regulator NreC